MLNVDSANWNWGLDKWYTIIALEGEAGFGPASPEGLPDFESGSIDHSDTPPH